MRTLIIIFLSFCVSSCSIRNDYPSVSSDQEFSKIYNGFIYTADQLAKSNFQHFKKYDIQKRQWVYMQNAPLFNQSQWDLKGQTFACVLQKDVEGTDDKISIFKMPSFNLIHELDYIDPEWTVPINYQKNGVRFVISPDETKLALLLIHSKTQTKEYGSDCYHFSPKSKLVILEINTGEKLFESKGYFLGTYLNWSPDSKIIYLTSFKNQSLWGTSTQDTCKDRGTKGIHYTKGGVFPIDIYSVNLKTGKISNIMNGSTPLIPKRGKEIFSDVWKRFYAYDIYKHDQITGNKKLIGNISSTKIVAISPDGKWFIGNYHTDIPNEMFSFLVDVGNLNNRLILDSKTHKHFAWVEK